MTAEIAVFNSTAIALAADSAATTGAKIYNSAEKLFELTKHHPVGVMIYNNATICGAPWELVIKAYRKQLGDKSFPTINGYSKDFFEYLSSNESIISEEMKTETIRKIFITSLDSIVGEVNNIDIVEYMRSKKADPTFDVFYSFLESRIKIEKTQLDSNDFLIDFEDKDIDEVREELEDVITSSINTIIPKEPNSSLPDSLIHLLHEYLPRLVCKKSNCYSYSGIVFSGYGDDEYYPSVINLNVIGIYKKKVLAHLDTTKMASNAKRCAIIPFAQDEEVVSFIEGCNTSVRDFTNVLARELLNKTRSFIEDEVLKNVIPGAAGDTKRSMDALWEQLLTEYHHKRTSYVRESQVDKVISMLSSLSKSDLAYMAESLVNLTAFKRKVSNEHDSVGGPIDVAVISKGDGFIWVKRKHYFKAELNQNFLNRNKE